MTSLQPQPRPVTPKPEGPHLPYELTWCAAEADNEINIAVTQLNDANKRVIRMVIGLLAVMSLFATANHSDLASYAPWIEAGGLAVGGYTALQIWRLQANTMNAHEALQAVTATRRVEVKGDLIDVTTLLAQPKKGTQQHLNERP